MVIQFVCSMRACSGGGQAGTRGASGAHVKVRSSVSTQPCIDECIDPSSLFLFHTIS